MKTIQENKKAYFDYEILEKFEAGVSLIGTEVKSIKTGRINLSSSYIDLRKGEAYLIGAVIPPYQPKNAPLTYNEKRDRKLLLNKNELRYLFGKKQQKGLTLIPLKIYTKGHAIKLEFAIAKGKKKADKRESLKKKEFQRMKEQVLKKGIKNF